MKQIGFITRDRAGNVERGNVSAQESVTAIPVSAGQEYSFNIRQSDILGFKRLGTNLEISLADGRVILLEGYFSNDGQPQAQLYVSSNTYISEVTLVEGANGELYGQYGVAESWGKYGVGDDLIFAEGAEIAHAADDGGDVTMLAAGLLAGLGGTAATAAAVVGGAAVIGAVAGGGDSAGPIVPTVEGGEVVVGGDDVTDADKTVTVKGTGAPGAQVEATVGDKTVATTVGDDGTWEAEFSGDNFPADGDYQVGVKHTDSSGNVTELDGPHVVIDTTPPVVNADDGVQASGDMVTAANHADGATISGKGEAGASVSVTIDGTTHETVVASDGTWSVDFAQSEIEAGEYTRDVTIVSKDSYGNSTTVTETLVVDTVSEVSLQSVSTGSDQIVNNAEHGDGVTLTGTTQPGSTVVVTLDGVEKAATVDADGNWTVTYDAGQLRSGEYTGDVSVVATDAAGNVASTTGTVQFDTLVRDYTVTSNNGGADNVVNEAETGAGVSFSGTVEPGSSVMVNFAGVDRAATVDANGNWTVDFSGAEVPQADGKTFVMTAVATDGAGNTSSLTQNVEIDNVAGALALSAEPIETDQIVNANEAADGVVVRGTSDPGNVVEVKLGDATLTVVTAADGTWSANFPANVVPAGEYDAPITAITTDAAGNSRTVTGTVEVDTLVRNLSVSGDNITADNVVNAAERGDGVTFTGTTEPGSTSVVVTIDGKAHNASVDADGNWSVTFPSGDLPTGENSYQMDVAVTDRAGNTASTNRMVRFDTLVNELSGGAVEEGGTAVFNAADVADGVTVEGKVEPGSAVKVEFGGQFYDATVDASGNWSVDLPASAFSAQSYSAELKVHATDAYGNTDSFTETLVIDAALPEAAEVDGYSRDHTGYRAVEVLQSDDTQSVYEVDGTNVKQVAQDSNGVDIGANTYYQLSPTVQDGSHLVVTTTDSAGNTSGTFMALDDPATSDINMTSVNPALSGLEIETIDLTFAEDTNLTLSVDQVKAFAEHSDTVAIRGGSDDTVTLQGATRTGETVTENGQTYDVYTVDDHKVLIDDDINTII